jgi:hypothetical protein
MAVNRYQFDRFSLDPVERRLYAGETVVELNSRYFDALLLLLRHPGTLLSKECQGTPSSADRAPTSALIGAAGVVGGIAAARLVARDFSAS